MYKPITVSPRYDGEYGAWSQLGFIGPTNTGYVFPVNDDLLYAIGDCGIECILDGFKGERLGPFPKMTRIAVRARNAEYRVALTISWARG